MTSDGGVHISDPVLRDHVDTLRAELAALRGDLRVQEKISAQHADRAGELWRDLATVRALLAEVLETTASCHCEEAYTARGLHAPECHYDEVDEARAFLDPRRDAIDKVLTKHAGTMEKLARDEARGAPGCGRDPCVGEPYCDPSAHARAAPTEPAPKAGQVADGGEPNPDLNKNSPGGSGT